MIRLHEYDKENGTDYLNTLETYLRCDRSLKAAAAHLFIHRNTLVYRLRSIEKIVSLNLDNPHEKLHVLLSCVILREHNTSKANAR